MESVYIDPKAVDFSLVKRAAETLEREGTVIVPTETVYGIAGLAGNKKVEEKLYAIKKRPRNKPFSLALAGIEDAVYKYFAPLSPFGYRLIENFCPGPLTIIYYDKKYENIGVRVPSHEVTRQILKELARPLYLPSANLSGAEDAAGVDEIETEVKEAVDLVVDSGRCGYAKSSTIIDLTASPFKILREGVVSQRDVVDVFVKKRIIFVCTGNSCRSPLAEFLLKKYISEDEAYLKDRYEVVSAGLSALEGAEPAPEILEILDKEGIDARSFRSSRLNNFDILSSDFIITMEDFQSEYILRSEPTAEGRVFCLKKFLPPDLEKDIPDPIGKELDYYRRVYNMIKSGVSELVEWL
ncbi:MAG: threonylcarbamoyl-AMP synthase [Candidatus Omnitrophica bacterium]|nr:threonylcarbamoyl-AMP synthase [Candidatus Omnitrophota bacterium]MBD3269298.1 threonylcarbamoyl-AMP synthase [Candidatus Omnitrophota bacterium]